MSPLVMYEFSCRIPAGCPGAECPGFHSALSEPSPSSRSSGRRVNASSWRLAPVWFLCLLCLDPDVQKVFLCHLLSLRSTDGLVFPLLISVIILVSFLLPTSGLFFALLSIKTAKQLSFMIVLLYNLLRLTHLC